MSGDLDPFLAEHPDGAPHRRHGVVTVDHAGVSAEREGRRLPWDYRAPGMRAWCGCGWVGITHPQAQVAERVGSAARRAEWDREHRPLLRAMDAEWSEHVHTALPTLRVLDVMAELRDAERALTAVVIDARAAGASWTEVAAATGTRRQAAHARWRRHDPLLPHELSKGGRPRRAAPTSVDTPPGDTTDQAGTVEEPLGADGAAAPAPEPAPGPSSATDHAHVTGRRVRRLAAELSGRVDRHVEASWQGTRSRDGSRGGWLMEWTGGPNRTEMRELAATVIARIPELAGLDVSGLSWWRSGGSDVDDAAAVLAWLEEHPDDGAQLPFLSPDQFPGWPERLPARLRARAETLAAAGWAHQTAGPAADTLHRHARDGGPTAVWAWLDDLANSQNAPVLDLHSHRRS